MGVLVMEDAIRSNNKSVTAAPKKKWIQHYMQGEEPKDSAVETIGPGTRVTDYLEHDSANLQTAAAQFTSVLSGSYFTEDGHSSRSQSPTRILIHGNESGILSYALPRGCHAESVRSRGFDEILNKSSRIPATSLPAYIVRNDVPLPPRNGAFDFLELKKRNGAGTREVHNKLEKNRRAHLRECFELLRKQLPSVDDKKLSNLGILKNALRYIQSLKRKDRDSEQSVEQLARQKILLQHRLAELRLEVSSIVDSSSATMGSASSRMDTSSVTFALAEDLGNLVPGSQPRGSPMELTYANVEAHNLRYSRSSGLYNRAEDDDMCSSSTSTASETGNIDESEPGLLSVTELGREDKTFQQWSQNFHSSPRTSSVMERPGSPRFSDRHQSHKHLAVSGLPAKFALHRTGIPYQPARITSVSKESFLVNGSGGFCFPASVVLPGLGAEASLGVAGGNLKRDCDPVTCDRVAVASGLLKYDQAATRDHHFS